MGGALVFLALVLGVSALNKLLQHDRAAAATAALVGVGPVIGMMLMVVAGAVEFCAALLLLMPGLAPYGAAVAGILWAIYAVALFRRRGQTLDCGCDLRMRKKPVGAVAIGRPVALALVAVAVAAAPSLAFTIETPFTLLALLALFVAAGQLDAISFSRTLHMRHQ